MSEEKQKEFKLMIFNEKKGDRYFIINAEKDKSRIALKIFKERNRDDVYDEIDPKHQQFFDLALNGDGEAALTFLNLRSRCQYEGFVFDIGESI